MANRDHFIPPGEPTPNQLFNGGVYFRGALTLHALRLEVGDDAFFETLRTYHEEYKGSNATTEDFIAIAGEASFLSTWNRLVQYPVYVNAAEGKTCEVTECCG